MLLIVTAYEIMSLCSIYEHNTHGRIWKKPHDFENVARLKPEWNL